MSWLWWCWSYQTELFLNCYQGLRRSYIKEFRSIAPVTGYCNELISCVEYSRYIYFMLDCKISLDIVDYFIRIVYPHGGFHYRSILYQVSTLSPYHASISLFIIIFVMIWCILINGN